MTKISMRTRLYLAIIGVNLIFLGLFLFIVGFLNFYEESVEQLIAQISSVLIGGLMILIGLRGIKRNNPRKSIK
jgi:hypothetical protein